MNKISDFAPALNEAVKAESLRTAISESAASYANALDRWNYASLADVPFDKVGEFVKEVWGMDVTVNPGA